MILSTSIRERGSSCGKVGRVFDGTPADPGSKLVIAFLYRTFTNCSLFKSNHKDDDARNPKNIT